MIKMNVVYKTLLLAFGVSFILIGGNFLEGGILQFIFGIILIVIGAFAVILYGKVTE